MYNIARNKNGETLYIFVDVTTNSIKPNTYVSTWENVIKRFNILTRENNDNNYLVQLIHKVINERSAEASMRCNKKGWGYDYFRYITIEALYIDD